ncbi:DUF349 domain-containing protein [Corynebacterium sp. 13CS0277]|uniref:DUF349 domain-containing protein n=1 Tax=Corynebacterium sp. 13CS0277 TaxID=2071994 RepID=UPI000D0370A1|nr:DUF349 domain-containing protein [Corynebacterium sp. 13CS0277]PRQ10554.1 DUF349 domain-containing protein [Corynebacterium sp. 13CS0277]
MTAHPTPKPGPRPGPRPGQVRSTPVPAPAARPAVGGRPQDFGRVDDDGQVFVFTADGERKIGEWKAGTPAEGLEHYATRYADLATEVNLLAVRLTSHPGEAQQIRAAAQALREGLPEATVIGDIPALDAELQAIIDASGQAEAQAKQAKAERRAQAIARKEALAAEAEDLAANSTEWKKAGDRFRTILEEWKTIRGIERSTDEELWKRYAKARDAFNHRRGAHFAELDRTRAAARRAKEDLVARAEALKDSTDWAETARAFKQLMDEWRAAGRASRDHDQKLWEAFRAAQDHFFAARNKVTEEKDAEFAANADAKDALIAEYGPKIDPEADIEHARTLLRELQDKWENIGFVPRQRVREFEDKIAAIERRVADAADAQWRRTDPAAQARAAQFTAKVAELTQQAEAAEAAGKSAKAATLREQAQQWQQWADAAANAVDNL